MKIIHDKLKVHSLTGRITSDLMLKAYKVVESRFHKKSCGFRPGRNCHPLKEAAAARISGGNILNITERFLTSGLLANIKMFAFLHNIRTTLSSCANINLKQRECWI